MPLGGILQLPGERAVRRGGSDRHVRGAPAGVRRDLPAGVRQPRPDACIEVEMPVCGCDGKTYGNACKATMAGVSVESNAACN